MREKAIKIKRKRCASDWFLDIFKVVFLVLVTVICVYPFWNIFVVSINDATDALRGGLYFLPRKLSLASYKDILGRATFLHGILITVLRTAIGTPPYPNCPHRNYRIGESRATYPATLSANRRN